MTLTFGFHLDQPSPPLDEMLRQAKRSKEAGFDSIWLPDHILTPPPERSFVPDAYMTLAVLAADTTKLRLGTLVTCVHRRSYAVLAHLIATLDHFSGGRAILGVGSGESMNLDPFGLEWDRPVSRTVEALELLKRLWQEEEPFSFEGEFYTLDNGFLQLAPVQKPHPQIFFAANGPRSLRLVGRYYDGWLPLLETPKTYKDHVAVIEESAKEAERSIDNIECSLVLVTAVCEDSEEAYEMIAPYRYFLVNLPKKLTEAGYDPPPGYSDNYYLEDLMVTREDQERYEKAKEYISEEMVREFSVIGNVDECITHIERYRKAGLDHLIIFSADPDIDRTLNLYEKEIIPYFADD